MGVAGAQVVGARELLVGDDAEEEGPAGEQAGVGGVLGEQGDPQGPVEGGGDVEGRPVGVQRVGGDGGGDVEGDGGPAGHPPPLLLGQGLDRVLPAPALGGAGGLGGGRLADGEGLQGPGDDLVVGLEGDRAGPGLGSAQHLHALGAFGLQDEEGAGGERGSRADAEEAQEGDLRGVGDLVEAEEQ